MALERTVVGDTERFVAQQTRRIPKSDDWSETVDVTYMIRHHPTTPSGDLRSHSKHRAFVGVIIPNSTEDAKTVWELEQLFRFLVYEVADKRDIPPLVVLAEHGEEVIWMDVEQIEWDKIHDQPFDSEELEQLGQRRSEPSNQYDHSTNQNTDAEDESTDGIVRFVWGGFYAICATVLVSVALHPFGVQSPAVLDALIIGLVWGVSLVPNVATTPVRKIGQGVVSMCGALLAGVRAVFGVVSSVFAAGATAISTYLSAGYERGCEMLGLTRVNRSGLTDEQFEAYLNDEMSDREMEQTIEENMRDE